MRRKIRSTACRMQSRQVKPRTARRQRSREIATSKPVFSNLIKETADESSTHGQAHQGRSTLDQHGRINRIDPGQHCGESRCGTESTQPEPYCRNRSTRGKKAGPE